MTPQDGTVVPLRPEDDTPVPENPWTAVYALADRVGALEKAVDARLSAMERQLTTMSTNIDILVAALKQHLVVCETLRSGK